MRELRFSNEREVFKGHIFTLSNFDVTAGKKTVSWEFLEAHNAPRSVDIVPIDSKGNVYLVSEYCYPVGKREITVAKGAAGERGTLKQAKAELKEELGITAGRVRKLGILTMLPGYFRHYVDLYLAEDLSFGKPEPEEFEFVRTVKLPMKEAIKLCLSGKIRESSTVAAIFLAAEKLKEEGKL